MLQNTKDNNSRLTYQLSPMINQSQQEKIIAALHHKQHFTIRKDEHRSQNMQTLFNPLVKMAQIARPTTILVILCAAQLSAAAKTPTDPLSSQILVKTTSGLLAGAQVKVQNISRPASVYKFLSVAYAQAPIGQLRFQKPVPMDKLANANETIVDASSMGPTCAQFRHLTNFISPLLNVDQEHKVSEDCLHLHIYAPAKALQQQEQQLNAIGSPLPVIVWIPGEGFDYADARQFDGSQLALQANAIVVSVQYRVGVLGFLNAPQWNVSGNMGLYDQLAALHWISQNINAFGGDSNNVSLMGRFTGAMSISSLLTAPNQKLIRSASSGQLLFKRVALLSGITVDRWIIDAEQHERAPILSEQAHEKSLCAPNSNGLECLQSLPVGQLIQMADFAWRPSQDNQLIGELMPSEAIRAGQFPTDLESVLLGETAAEGSLCLMRHMLTQNSFAQLLEVNKLTSDDLYDMIRDDSQFYFKHQLAKSNPIQRALEQMSAEKQQQQDEYDVNSISESSEKLREKYVSACSSYLVKYHAEQFKREILLKNKLQETRLDINKKPISIYHYELAYRPSYSLAPDYIKTSSHGDDVPLMFGLVFSEQARGKVTQQDLSMSLRMMQLISDFAHGKKPTQINDNDLKQLSKRRAHSIEMQPQQLLRWTNEGKKMTIQVGKGDELVNRSDDHSEESNGDEDLVTFASTAPKKQANDKIIVFIERESKQKQQPQSWSVRTDSIGDDFTQQARYVSRAIDTNNQNNLDWISLDLTKQPTSSNSITNDAKLSLDSSKNHGLVMLMIIAALIMTLVIFILGFSLMRLQRNFNRVCKILDDHRKLLRLDRNQHHSDDSSQGPKSEASLEAVLALDSKHNQHDNNLHNSTSKSPRPFCNMLNKLSNHHSQLHSSHHDDELNTNINELDRTSTTHLTQSTNLKKGVQGSSIGLARRNSNSSDQIALKINEHEFNHNMAR